MTLITRAEWGWEGPLGPRLRLPVREVWLHHSVTTPTDDPARDMRTLERIGQSRFGRFSYSYAVHPSGAVLEGQGTYEGAHTKRRNPFSMGVVLIGNYEANPVPAKMLDGVAWLLNMIERLGYGPGQLTGGHRDVVQTSCPGIHAYRAIRDINMLARMRAAEESSPSPTQEDEDVARSFFAKTKDNDTVYWVTDTPRVKSKVGVFDDIAVLAGALDVSPKIEVVSAGTLEAIPNAS